MNSRLGESRKVIGKSSDKDAIFFRNKMLNELEISQKNIILESKPMYLGVTLSSKCNLRCIMCRVAENTWDVSQNIITEIIRLFPFLKRISWQGGEVFLLDYFGELFEKAAFYPNLKQTIVTNGLLIDKKWAEKLARCNADIIFSIDGVTKKTYEHIRRGARFEDLIRSIETLNAY
jgi:MoaA/NifB/PqqE/SkfB family radical SAM enzyme